MAEAKRKCVFSIYSVFNFDTRSNTYIDVCIFLSFITAHKLTTSQLSVGWLV